MKSSICRRLPKDIRKIPLIPNSSNDNFLQLNEEGLFEEIKQLVAEEFDLSHLFSLYIDAIKLIIDTLEAYFETLVIDGEELTLVQRKDLYDDSLQQDRLHQKIHLYYKEILEIQQRLQTTFMATEERRLARERAS